MNNKTFGIKSITRVSIFTALIAIGAFLKVPIPYVPFTLQCMFVIMAGLVLGKRDGAMASLLYLLIGLAGIPIFTQGGGLGYVFQPSFGYLVSFPIAGYLAGLLLERLSDKQNKAENPSSTKGFNPRAKIFMEYMIASFIPLFVIYIIGGVYAVNILHFVVGKSYTLTDALWYFFILLFPGNAASVVLGAVVARKLNKML